MLHFPLLNKYCNKLGTEKGITAIHSEKFKGIIQWRLMDWWNNSLSKSYKEAEIYD